MIGQFIADKKTENSLKINGEGEIGVVVHTHPPIAESLISKAFRQYFTADGTSSGSNDLRVDGTTTAQKFYIEAQPKVDIFIKSISVKLADQSAVLNKFGNLAALATGMSFEWISQEEGTVTIHDAIKDNLEFFRMSAQAPAIVDISGGGADAVMCKIYLNDEFGSPWGVKLKKGTTERLQWTVNDDLSTGIDEFNIIGTGTQV